MREGGGREAFGDTKEGSGLQVSLPTSWRKLSAGLSPPTSPQPQDTLLLVTNPLSVLGL